MPSTNRYVGQAACADCHAQETAAWLGSDHQLAMAAATPEHVLGDFSGVTFTEAGVETHFFTEDGRYYVRTEGSTGEESVFEVKYTFGVRPLQQYLVIFERGRLQALTVAWDTENERWFSLYPGQRFPPGDFVHWTGRGMNWNYMCADCHSTNLRRNYDLATDSYSTTYSEVNVSCESCHGPGEAHLAWANARTPDTTMGLTVRMGRTAPSINQIETCAPCHARRVPITDDFLPGSRFLDHYMPELLDEALYHADGQIKDEVFEYGSFLQSKMFQQGVRCTDCHDAHSSRLKIQGNSLCTQCHTPAQYDVQRHHFHPENSAGASCMNCHMPQTTYMVVDPRRDHSFKVPRPDLTLEIGIPNACTGCHADQPVEWARDHFIAWYGAERRDTVEYARVIAAGRSGAAGADESLAALVRYVEMPAIIRATALSLLRNYDTPGARATVAAALKDSEPLVRTEAVRGFSGASDARLEAVDPLLSDPVRLVRLEATRVLAPAAGRRYLQTRPTARTTAFWNAIEEYRRSQEVVQDQPEAHLNLAVLHEQLGEPERAEEAYRTAIRLDSTFAPAHVNLAMLLNHRRTAAVPREAERLYADSERHLRIALRKQPDLAEVHYTLGLLLAEDAERLADAAVHLREAALLAPAHARVQYNAGLAFQHLGDTAEAERFLLAAHRMEPRQGDFLNALAIFYAQQERWETALHYLDLLISEYPEAPALQQQRRHFEQQLRSSE